MLRLLSAARDTVAAQRVWIFVTDIWSRKDSHSETHLGTAQSSADYGRGEIITAEVKTAEALMLKRQNGIDGKKNEGDLAKPVPKVKPLRRLVVKRGRFVRLVNTGGVTRKISLEEVAETLGGNVVGKSPKI